MTYEFNEDGTITFNQIGGKKLDLRTPTLQQLLGFKRSWQKIIRYNNRFGVDVTQREKELPEDASAEDQLALAEEVQDQVYELIDRFTMWHLDVISTLADKNVKEEDLPAYFADLGLPARMIQHWQGNPKASGTTPDQ